MSRYAKGEKKEKVTPTRRSASVAQLDRFVGKSDVARVQTVQQTLVGINVRVGGN